MNEQATCGLGHIVGVEPHGQRVDEFGLVQAVVVDESADGMVDELGQIITWCRSQQPFETEFIEDLGHVAPFGPPPNIDRPARLDVAAM